MLLSIIKYECFMYFQTVLTFFFTYSPQEIKLVKKGDGYVLACFCSIQVNILNGSIFNISDISVDSFK